MKCPKRVAAGKRAKSKGNTWQRVVARELSDWSGELWKATPRSGGLRWGDQNVFWTWGDLAPPVGCPIVCECKHYSEIDYLQILGTNVSDPGGGIVAGWFYDELLSDVGRASAVFGFQIPGFLVWKQDRRRPKLSVDLEFFNALGVYNLVTITAGVPGKVPIVTVDFRSFLESVPYEHLRKKNESRQPYESD